MKKLIINADDYGYNPEVVQAINELFELGLITSTSCLTNGSAWPQAADYLRKNPHFGAGVHLVFNDGDPVLPAHQVPALLDRDGRFMSDRQIMWSIRPGTASQLHAELRAQIERFINDVGRPPDHLDNHCSISYVRPDRFTVTLDLAQKYGLPIRAPFGDDFEELIQLYAVTTQMPAWLIRRLGSWYRSKVDRAGILRPNTFIQHYSADGNRTPEYLLNVLENLKEGWISELLVHPGYDSGWREQELQGLLDPRVRKRLAEPDIELVDFSALRA